MPLHCTPDVFLDLQRHIPGMKLSPGDPCMDDLALYANQFALRDRLYSAAKIEQVLFSDGRTALTMEEAHSLLRNALLERIP
ncbi:MAG: hypothetical protein AAB489_02715 [Patescibacteria group bacterium]